MTGSDDAGLRARAMQAGCVAFLTKPFTPPALTEALSAARRRSASHAVLGRSAIELTHDLRGLARADNTLAHPSKTHAACCPYQAAQRGRLDPVTQPARTRHPAGRRAESACGCVLEQY